MAHASSNVTVLPNKLILVPSDAATDIIASAPIYHGPGFKFGGNDTGFMKFKSNVDLIKDSIDQILSTRIGERVGVPSFGTNIHASLFEPDDDVLIASVASSIENAIHKWEPRVRLDSVSVFTDADNSQVNAIISMTIKRLGIPVTLRFEQKLPN